MGKHLHKRFLEKEVIDVFERYLSDEIGVSEALALLDIRRRRFFDLLKIYKEEPDKFSLEYKRRGANRRIDQKVEKKIMNELEKEREIIRDQRNPVTHYNYSYLRNLLETKHKIKVSLPTIIRRAKKGGFIGRRKQKRVMTERC